MTALSLPGTEIFGAAGVGKSTFVRRQGLESSSDALDAALVRRIRHEVWPSALLPSRSQAMRLLCGGMRHRYELAAFAACDVAHGEFLDLCTHTIWSSPVSAERKAACYRFLTQAVLAWWLVPHSATLVWDESFAKAALYACGMEPQSSNDWFPPLVRALPKRAKYIFLDGSADQSVTGQIRRGKFKDDMAAAERDAKVRSAEKYLTAARRLAEELRGQGCIVDVQTSVI